MKTTQENTSVLQDDESLDIIKLDNLDYLVTSEQTPRKFYYEVAKKVEELTHQILDSLADTYDRVG